MKRNWCLVAVVLALIGGLWMFANDTALIQAALGLKPAAASAAAKEKPFVHKRSSPRGDFSHAVSALQPLPTLRQRMDRQVVRHVQR